ncbi:MAG: GNAT family N-acetyltransferase [Armatimonadota bacterium]
MHCELIHWETATRERIRAAWGRLLAANPQAQLFSYPEWLETAIDSGIATDCHILLIETGNIPIGILPLQRRSRWTWEVVAPFAMDTSAILIDPRKIQTAWTAVARWLRSTHRLEALSLGICAEQQSVDALIEVCRSEGSGLQIAAHPPTTRIPLAPTWDEYLNTLEKRIRRNLRHAEHQFERDYPNAAIEIIDRVETCEEALAALIRLYRARWADQAGGTIFDQPGHTAFFQRAMRWAITQDYAKLFVLRDGQRLITVLCILHIPGQAYAQAYYVGRDPAAVPSKYSPGVLVMNAAIRWSIEQGLTHFQTGSGNYLYKHWLNCEDAPLWHLTLTRRPLAGKVFLGMERGAYLIRRLPLHAVHQLKRLGGKLRFKKDEGGKMKGEG